MEYTTIVSTTVNSILGCILVICIGNLIFQENIKLKSKINIFALILYIIFLYMTAFINDKFMTTITSFLALILLYKVVYKKDWIETTFTGIITYTLILITELIIGSILLSLSYLFDINIVMNIKNTIIMNLLIMIPIFVLAMITKKYIILLVKYTVKNYDIMIVILFIISLLVFSIILNKYDIRNWFASFESYINTGIFLIIIVGLVILIVQVRKYDNYVKKYSELADYSSKHDEVLEEYRLKSHEFNNELAIIKTMISPKNKELNEYVDNLIEKNKKVKYNWINKVKYIKLEGLKGLLNYKIMEFESLKINNSIVISKNLSKEKFENLTMKNKDGLYSIIGVYLDNAKEASLESKEKEISIDISNNEEEVIIQIANTYKKNSIDVSKLDDYKYSTKGKNRGIGLFLVQKILNKNKDIFKSERQITDKYFIQTLYIKTK